MIRTLLVSLALAGAGLCVSMPAAAQDIAADAEGLSPGGFSWTTDAATTGPVRIVVSIPRQRAYVYRGDALVGVSTVSTGKEGHETPVGTFSILQKRETYFSNIYDSAPMPWMQRLTWDGIALHAGKIPGYPASHGCVRLPVAFARQLFALTRLGATVTITDADDATPAPATPVEPAENLLPPTMASGDSATPVASLAADRNVRLASATR